MDTPVLFPFLLNRMHDEGEDVPVFIGDFYGVEDLPKKEYSAVYYWVDTSLNRSVRLSFNTPKLIDWCVEEAQKLGIQVDIKDPSVVESVAAFQEIAQKAFLKSINETAH